MLLFIIPLLIFAKNYYVDNFIVANENDTDYIEIEFQMNRDSINVKNLSITLEVLVYGG